MTAQQTAEQRLAELLALRDRIDTEITRVYTANTGGPRRSRNVIPLCGTETAYQRHRLLGQDCGPCRTAHAIHERIVVIVRATRKRTSARRERVA